jgi:threonylcarbamoyladenosine tRNA methylthiotransferase MtaB
VKYSVLTFGCRVNQADSLGFEEELRARGARLEAAERADIVIVNTCSVTSSADQAARQTIRRLARTNPSARVVVTGCYATRRPDECGDSPNVLRVVPNREKESLVAWLATDQGLTTAERFGDGDGACGEPLEPGMAGRTAFTLRVQTGCAQPCSYCIIPSTRGEPRSVPIPDILSELERISAAGFKEIAITGVHLGSYGRDLPQPASLLALLRAIDDFNARLGWPVRFRISSLEPMDCSAEVVELVVSSDSFAPHFHLPLQHASDRILSAMRRPYTGAFYANLVDSIRRSRPDASIGSDLIAGFPGERDEDSEALCAYLERSPLTHIHVFPYSDRPGTAASCMTDKVPGAVVRSRAAQVREVGRRLTERFRAAQVGTVHRALTLADGTLAVTGNYLKVRIPPGCARNEWATIRITASGESMEGEVVDGVGVDATAEAPAYS